MPQLVRLCAAHAAYEQVPPVPENLAELLTAALSAPDPGRDRDRVLVGVAPPACATGVCTGNPVLVDYTAAAKSWKKVGRVPSTPKPMRISAMVNARPVS